MEDNPSNVREAIKKICEQQGGLNVLKSDYLAAMLDDYFPGDHREKKIVKNALKLGAGKEFSEIYTSFGSFNEFARAKFKLVFFNNIGMGDDAYRIVVDAFWYAVDPEGATAEIKAEEQRKRENDLKEALRKACEHQGGLNALKSDYLAALLDDYLPGDHREKKIVKIALKLGAGKEFCKIYTSFGSFNEAARAKFKMIFLNDIGMGDDAYRIVVDAFWYAVDPEGATAEIKAEEQRKREEKELEKSEEKAQREAEITRKSKEAKIPVLTVGATITFGKYPTNMDGSKQDIEWCVLKVEKGKALLISKYGIDAKPYNKAYEDITWEDCSMREWLNGDFLSTAFSSDEKRKILDTRVKAEKNPSYSTNPGNDTTDRIFLLSIQEAESLFKSGNDRMCVPTDYAKKNGAYTNDNYKVGGKPTCWCWLRSPGGNQSSAADVCIDGSVYSFGNIVSYDYVCVRPALWIDLES